MPKDVDHDARREELAESVWRVVAREGLERATIRRIAEETGWSAGSLAHYFADKDDMLESALRIAYERIAGRWDELLAGLSGRAALRELVMDNLPLDAERVLETTFLMNYWSRAIRDRENAPRAPHGGPLLVERITAYAREAQLAGELDGERSAQDIAEVLLGLIDGFSLHALLDPERLPARRQVALIDAELERMSQPRREEPLRATRRTTARRSHAA